VVVAEKCSLGRMPETEVVTLKLNLGDAGPTFRHKLPWPTRTTGAVTSQILLPSVAGRFFTLFYNAMAATAIQLSLCFICAHKHDAPRWRSAWLGCTTPNLVHGFLDSIHNRRPVAVDLGENVACLELLKIR
jgi:hypothetical protein